MPEVATIFGKRSYMYQAKLKLTPFSGLQHRRLSAPKGRDHDPQRLNTTPKITGPSQEEIEKNWEE